MADDAAKCINRVEGIRCVVLALFLRNMLLPRGESYSWKI